MRDIIEPLRAWLDAGADLALAVVVGLSGSAPRPLGTAMAVHADGTIAGNVSAARFSAADDGAAEIIALRRGGSGMALRETTGAIHAPRLAA